MQKPTRPRKPKKVEPKAPIQTLTSYYYPMEPYYQSSGSNVTFYDETTMVWPYYDANDTDEEQREREEFYDDNQLMSALPLPVIMQFAQEKNIPLEELQVEAYVPDREYGEYCILCWKRQIPDEEFQIMLAAHEAEKAAEKTRYEEALVAYAAAKEQYKVDKAAYDVHVAQQKLNALRSG